MKNFSKIEFLGPVFSRLDNLFIDCREADGFDVILFIAPMKTRVGFEKVLVDRQLRSFYILEYSGQAS